MWIYEQLSGRLYHDTMPNAGMIGYSGFEQGKNNPAMQEVPDVGPIPRGVYRIGPAFSDSEKGPLVMALSPLNGTEMFCRSGFLIHGDSIENPGRASHGCIIMPHEMRLTVSGDVDRQLRVV